ncbi:MAG: DUF262 domain-containing protein [Proteobacteria bacterium]|nr:DUF262 domain-containing protein [Pseudomonadota bacterium]
MTESVQPTKTVFTVSQFLDWQRHGTLDLSPVFQRRPVWKPNAKSLLIDSVVRGFPIPIVLLRQVQDLHTLKMKMEVVDGQQRLRTLLAYIDHASLPTYDAANDSFTVKRIHNAELSGKLFKNLDADQKHQILGYQISTHVFPATTSDGMVFRMFARLNSTGLSLNKQEIRNAEYHGAFKSLVYQLSFEWFDAFRSWGVYKNQAISRMDEAEAISEFLMLMKDGMKGKSQPRIDKFYEANDEKFDDEAILRSRFQSVLSAMDTTVGPKMEGSAFQRPALFFSLFGVLYSHMYGLPSRLVRKRGRPLPSSLAADFERTSKQIIDKKLTKEMQDAADKATADKARREVRHKFLIRSLRLEPNH